MEKLIHDLKVNIFLKIYLTLSTLINLVYTYFEVSRYLYIQKYSLEGTIEKYQFEYLSNISRITTLLESLIILIYLGYLIKVVLEKDRRNMMHFLVINLALIVIFALVNCLVSVVFSIPIQTLTMLLYISFLITIISLICFGLIVFHRKKGSVWNLCGNSIFLENLWSILTKRNKSNCKIIGLRWLYIKFNLYNLKLKVVNNWSWNIKRRV